MHCGPPNQNFGRAMAHPAHAAAPPHVLGRPLQKKPKAPSRVSILQLPPTFPIRSVRHSSKPCVCVCGFRGGVGDNEGARLRQRERAGAGTNESSRVNQSTRPAAWHRYRHGVRRRRSNVEEERASCVYRLNQRTSSSEGYRQADHGATTAASCSSSRLITCRRHGNYHTEMSR